MAKTPSERYSELREMLAKWPHIEGVEPPVSMWQAAILSQVRIETILEAEERVGFADLVALHDWTERRLWQAENEELGVGEVAEFFRDVYATRLGAIRLVLNRRADEVRLGPLASLEKGGGLPRQGPFDHLAARALHRWAFWYVIKDLEDGTLRSVYDQASRTLKGLGYDYSSESVRKSLTGDLRKGLESGVNLTFDLARHRAHELVAETALKDITVEEVEKRET